MVQDGDSRNERMLPLWDDIRKLFILKPVFLSYALARRLCSRMCQSIFRFPFALREMRLW
jgi:hypothetical protein